MLKLKILYYRILLRLKYKMKPNGDGTYDLKSCPGFKDAKL